MARAARLVVALHRTAGRELRETELLAANYAKTREFAPSLAEISG